MIIIVFNFYNYFSGATVSENESFSLPSTEEDSVLTSSATQPSHFHTYKTIIPKAREIKEQPSQSKNEDILSAVHDNLEPKSFMVVEQDSQLSLESGEEQERQTTELSVVQETIDSIGGIFTTTQSALDTDKDVVMEDSESEGVPSLPPPPLPAKQIIHIKNSFLNDESAVSLISHLDTAMDTDNATESNIDVSSVTELGEPTEEMEVCEENNSNVSSQCIPPKTSLRTGNACLPKLQKSEIITADNNVKDVDRLGNTEIKDATEMSSAQDNSITTTCAPLTFSNHASTLLTLKLPCENSQVPIQHSFSGQGSTNQQKISENIKYHTKSKSKSNDKELSASNPSQLDESLSSSKDGSTLLSSTSSKPQNNSLITAKTVSKINFSNNYKTTTSMIKNEKEVVNDTTDFNLHDSPKGRNLTNNIETEKVINSPFAGYTNEPNLPLIPTMHSKFHLNKKEATNNKYGPGDSHLKTTLGLKVITKLRDKNVENVGVEADSKGDNKTNEGKWAHEKCIIDYKNETTANAKNTSPTYNLSSSKIVQSRPNSLSSTSPNAVSAQSLFLTTPMPYSKPSSFLSPTSSSPPTITSVVPDSSRSIVCLEQENGEKKVRLLAGNENNDCTGNESVELRRNKHYVDHKPIETQTQRHDDLNDNISTDTAIITTIRPRTNSVNAIKSKFESMDYSDSSIEQEIFCTSHTSVAEDNLTQPNSSINSSLLTNVPKPMIEETNSGRRSADGFSTTKSNQQKLQFATAVPIEPNLTKNTKCSTMCRSAEGGILGTGRKKLSTVSLQGVDESIRKVTICSNQGEEDNEQSDEPGQLQRRNSIHNVPYVDVNDPDTRARMERYKEERRSTLRAKYKVEDYRSEKQQPSMAIKNIAIVSTLDKETPSATEEVQEADNGKRLSPITVEGPIISHQVPIQETKTQSSISLRKLPVNQKMPNNQMSTDVSSHQKKLTNVNQAKSNADRKWSLQTASKHALSSGSNNVISHKQSPPQKSRNSNKNNAPVRAHSHQGSGGSASPGQFHRSSYPPQNGRVEEDVNVKERAALWNGAKAPSNNKSYNSKNSQKLVTDKSPPRHNLFGRKISAPASQSS